MSALHNGKVYESFAWSPNLGWSPAQWEVAKDIMQELSLEYPGKPILLISLGVGVVAGRCPLVET